VAHPIIRRGVRSRRVSAGFSCGGALPAPAADRWARSRASSPPPEFPEVFRDRQLERIEEIKEKLDGDNSTKWQNIYEGWLAEAEEKLQSAEEQIERLKAWIREGGEKLGT
jgi:hypothetical protein